MPAPSCQNHLRERWPLTIADLRLPSADYFFWETPIGNWQLAIGNSMSHSATILFVKTLVVNHYCQPGLAVPNEHN